MQRVIYAFPTLHTFRAPFHNRLRRILYRHKVSYDYIYAGGDPSNRGNTTDLAWASTAGLTRLFGTNIAYHQIWRRSMPADLVILQQENALLSNHVVQWTRRLTGKKVAFFGHGRNFQSRSPNGLGERLKRANLPHVDWWFAYTSRSAAIVRDAGFPAERITVFNNTLDTEAIANDLKSISTEERAAFRNAHFDGSAHVGLYLGSLYEDKRLPFLLEAALAVRRRLPDFHLAIVGGGPLETKLRSDARQHSWIHVMGTLFGREKAIVATIAGAILVPGAIGLVAVDAFAHGTPLVTTSFPYHGPEFEYLKDGENAVIVRQPDDPEAYAHAVITLLTEDRFSARLRAGCAASASIYTMGAMTNRFADGVLSALAL